MIILPLPVVVRPNAVVTFSCLAWSYGSLVYDWITSNNSTLPSNSSVFFYKTPLPADTNCITTVCELKILNVQVIDEGLYCCEASNECGSIKKCAWLEVDSKLYLYKCTCTHFVLCIASPVIIKQPRHKIINEKERSILILWIVATGEGPIQYQWKKYDPFNNRWVPPSSRAVNITSPNLTFSIITEEDQGIYHCIVSNSDGHVVSDNANVTVYGKLLSLNSS